MMLWPLSAGRRLVRRFRKWRARFMFSVNGRARIASGRCPVCGDPPRPLREEGPGRRRRAVYLRVRVPGVGELAICADCFLEFNGLERRSTFVRDGRTIPIDTSDRVAEVLDDERGRRGN